MTRILIIEDDTILSRLVVNWLEEAGMKPECVTSIREGFTRLKKLDYDLILSDLRLPDGSGIIIEKPVHDIPLLEAIQKALDERAKNGGDTKIIKRVSKAYQQLVEKAELVAGYDLSVMIRGESGAGKEHIAHILHNKSTRRNKPFVKVDCATITKDLAPSILFGHEKGAFTGADTNATGLFHEAEGGTLYFDEIGNLPIEAQQVLLRVLQERKYIPLGPPMRT